MCSSRVSSVGRPPFVRCHALIDGMVFLFNEFASLAQWFRSNTSTHTEKANSIEWTEDAKVSIDVKSFVRDLLSVLPWSVYSECAIKSIYELHFSGKLCNSYFRAEREREKKKNIWEKTIFTWVDRVLPFIRPQTIVNRDPSKKPQTHAPHGKSRCERLKMSDVPSFLVDTKHLR